jgi:hypothetical protein
MKKTLLTNLIVLCALVGTAMGSQIGSLIWNKDNLRTLRSLDKAAVVKFLNERTGKLGSVVTPQEVWEYEWVDLAGDGKYELVVTGSSGPCCVGLTIINRDTAGKLSAQNFEGAGQLSQTIRDLNGDGKKELVLWPEIAEPGTWAPSIADPRWPAVYRLEKGKYVEASRDFPNFYDTEILPKLKADISNARNNDVRAILTLERDKILRVLGRNPVAGLNQAYQWMNSDDSQLLQCAVATFRDIGGHDKEMREAQQKIGPAFKHEIEARKGG